jgi:type-F conjugative transfer system pilin assembly protein TrbC
MASISAFAACAALIMTPARGQTQTHAEAVDGEEVSSLEAQAAEAAKAAKAAGEADTELTSRAKEAAKAASPEVWKLLMGDMSATVLGALGVEDETNIEMETSSPPEGHPASAVIVFVSSSMPLTTLRRYAADLERTGGAMILRGGVSGLKAMGPTVDLMMQILKVDPSCEGVDCDMRAVSILIDPLVFRAAGVTRVPAVAVVDRDPFQSYCERETPDARSDAWIMTTGDASLEGHLEELKRRGERRAASVLSALRRTALRKEDK